MDVTLAYPSSLECWKHLIRPTQRTPKRHLALKQGSFPAASSEELRRLENLGISLPLHCFCDSPNHRRNTPELICHVAPNGGRDPIFVDVPSIPGLRVSCLEHTLMQASTKMELIPFLKLCYQLCGTYEIDNDGMHDKLAPLTSVAQCQQFLEGYPCFRGSKPFRKALRYLSDNSASPRETVVALLLTLPHSRGGYGLPMPMLNMKVPVKGRLLKPDLYWENSKVGIEYDSNDWHTNAYSIARDARRKNEFTFSNYKMLTLTNQQLEKVNEMDLFAQRLARLLDVRLRIRRSDFEQKQYLLRVALLGKYQG